MSDEEERSDPLAMCAPPSYVPTEPTDDRAMIVDLAAALKKDCERPHGPTDEARAWAERVCARMVEVADAKGGPMLDDDVEILASEVAPIMRERDETQAILAKWDKDYEEQVDRADMAEERARIAEEELRHVSDINVALDVANDWQEIADEMGRTLECPQATCRHEPSCPGCAALARYYAAKREP